MESRFRLTLNTVATVAARSGSVEAAADCLDIRHSDLAMRVSHGNAAAGPMATRESITTVGQGARGAP